mmetsp:Transcript_35344/g.80182  ORF Transcript_35344/g.80182 Transcript_35344/m.80182 type:complete len:228 (+) Transcript_35344:3322-4005(+)
MARSLGSLRSRRMASTGTRGAQPQHMASTTSSGVGRGHCSPASRLPAGLPLPSLAARLRGWCSHCTDRPANVSADFLQAPRSCSSRMERRTASSSLSGAASAAAASAAAATVPSSSALAAEPSTPHELQNILEHEAAAAAPTVERCCTVARARPTSAVMRSSRSGSLPARRAMHWRLHPAFVQAAKADAGQPCSRHVSSLTGGTSTTFSSASACSSSACSSSLSASC